MDDTPRMEIILKEGEFANISSASAQEVADAITRGIRSLGKTGSAVAKDDGSGAYVEIFSDTIGPSSSVRILGGRAQNELKFDLLRPTSGEAATQWSAEQRPDGTMRVTWTGGPNPSMGRSRAGDYVNIYSDSFSEENRGTFTLTEVQGGTVGNAYFQYLNPLGITETVLQGTQEGVLFFSPTRRTLNSRINFAAGYQVTSGVLEVFLPATTRVIRRDRRGAAHLHDPDFPVTEPGMFGPYLFDLSKPYTIGGIFTETIEDVDLDSDPVIQVADAGEFPDEFGHLVIGLGTSHEEGPIPYVSRPSSGSILVSPAYNFRNRHPAGSDVSFIIQNSPYIPRKDGSDFPFYITDVISGREYAEEMIRTVAAAGITLVITILYPNDIGLGKWGKDSSEKEYIWGGDLWPKELKIDREGS
jgi:hypothetical protein